MAETFIIIIFLCVVTFLLVDLHSTSDKLKIKCRDLNFKIGLLNKEFSKLESDFVKFGEETICCTDILYDYIDSIYEELESKKEV